MLTKPNRFLRPLRYGAAMITLAFAAGCAQNPVTEDMGRSSTLHDAQEQARGGRDRGHAGSQWSLGWGGSKKPVQQNDAAAQMTLSELNAAQTYIGTITCGTSTAVCSPVHVVITLHPNGIWRLRATGMNTASAATVEQGCWHQIGTNPNRIILETQNNTVLTDLSFSSAKQVRVNVFNYMEPTLETHLSRQAELDRIYELENQTGPICRP